MEARTRHGCVTPLNGTVPVLGSLRDKKPVEDALKQVHEALAIGMFVLLLMHVAATRPTFR